MKKKAYDERDLSKAVELVVALHREFKAFGIDLGDWMRVRDDELLRGDIAMQVYNRLPFAPPNHQIRTILEINDKVWKDKCITEQVIRAVGDPPPPPEREGIPETFCLCLLYETGNPLKTLARNIAACKYVFGKDRWKKDLARTFSDTERNGPKPVVSVRKGARPRPAGFRWAVVNLGFRYRGRPIPEARADLDQKGLMGVGQELPLIAALHPRWATLAGLNPSIVHYFPEAIAPDLDYHVKGAMRGALSLSGGGTTFIFSSPGVWIGGTHLIPRKRNEARNFGVTFFL
ncbi:MAG: hypothetical protein WC526_02285 [Patescibacteria group bacterium]